MRTAILLLAMAFPIAGCDKIDNMSTSQKGALTGAALGTGIAAGYITSNIQDSNK